MPNTEYYLDSEGLARLVNYINSALDNKADINDIADLPENVVVREDLEPYAKKTDIPPEADLTPYATNEALDELRNSVQGVYHFRGSVDNLTELQAIQDPAEGDVYNIRDTGMNAAWTGEVWDDFGSIADLSDYMTFDDVQPIAISEVDRILYSGKRAVVADRAGIDAMLANDQAAVEVVLSDNLALDSYLVVPAGKKVTIDLGGKELNCADNSKRLIVNGEVELKNGDIVADTGRAIQVQNGGSLVINGADITAPADCAIDVTGEGSSVTINNGTVTAQEVPVLLTSGGEAIVNGGTLVGKDNFAIGGNGSAGKGNTNIVINGGTLVGHIQSVGYIACAVYLPNDGSFTMNGGEIISDGCGICMRGGEVNLNGGSIVANGAAGVLGKVGDSRVVVGPYAVVYDANSKYPGMNSLALNIGSDVEMSGTDGDVRVMLASGVEANITNNNPDVELIND